MYTNHRSRDEFKWPNSRATSSSLSSSSASKEDDGRQPPLTAGSYVSPPPWPSLSSSSSSSTVMDMSNDMRHKRHMSEISQRHGRNDDDDDDDDNNEPKRPRHQDVAVRASQHVVVSTGDSRRNYASFNDSTSTGSGLSYTTYDSPYRPSGSGRVHGRSVATGREALFANMPRLKSFHGDMPGNVVSWTTGEVTLKRSLQTTLARYPDGPEAWRPCVNDLFYIQPDASNLDLEFQIRSDYIVPTTFVEINDQLRRLKKPLETAPWSRWFKSFNEMYNTWHVVTGFKIHRAKADMRFLTLGYQTMGLARVVNYWKGWYLHRGDYVGFYLMPVQDSSSGDWCLQLVPYRLRPGERPVRTVTCQYKNGLNCERDVLEIRMGIVQQPPMTQHSEDRLGRTGARFFARKALSPDIIHEHPAILQSLNEDVLQLVLR